MKTNRYLVDFDLSSIDAEHYDVVIIGSGIAGVYTGLEIPREYSVAILTKETIEISNSVLAQGGIAVSLDQGDSPELHFKDTIYAGAGLCNEESVWVLVNEAADNIKNLLKKYGVNFDRKGPKELSFSREAAHSKSRIIHAGDTTGKEVLDKLIYEMRKRDNITIKERTMAIDLLTEDGTSRGVISLDEDSGRLKAYLADVVICATGGYGQIYSNTTNPEVATGDGVCLAYRAGAELMDLEFVQFHPTVLYHPENKNFLISEAVRGEGAILRNKNGEAFMHRYHELKELAPRDVVSRAIFMEMQKTNSEHVYLDITFKSREFLENRFPNIYRTCLQYGIDISKDYIPVAPAEHYCMGGIKTDVHGRTNIKGFYACGEAACNGIHGANRLASNSLLEGLVFGHKIGTEVTKTLKEISGKKQKPDIKYSGGYVKSSVDVPAVFSDLRRIMTEKVGIIRNAEGLAQALESVDKYLALVENMQCNNVLELELKNALTLSRLVIESALERTESRGAHYRSDHPCTDNIKWRVHILKSVGSSCV